VAAKPPLIPPADPRRIARQLRLTGRVVLVVSLLTAGWMAWTEWRRTEPTLEEVLPGTQVAEARQMGEMYGLFMRDAWNVWCDVSRPYPAAVIIVASGLLVMWGCSRLARRHDAEAR
jgi:uncharacterized membrane protein YphA (DoxX/SURF4 family)